LTFAPQEPLCLDDLHYACRQHTFLQLGAKDKYGLKPSGEENENGSSAAENDSDEG
jgi:hypothetical protein